VNPDLLADVTEHNFLRITQEALANALKHSGAKKISVALNCEPSQVQLHLRDDGKGFDPTTVGQASGGHFGLLDMRERTEKIGGQFFLNSRPDGGTEILVRVIFATVNGAMPKAEPVLEAKPHSSPMKKKIRILVVDDHFVVRMGLTGSINLEPDMVVEAESSNGSQAIEQFRKHRPDIVLMDLKLPGLGGVEVTKAICKEFSDAAIIILSTHDGEEDIYRSLRAGARSYLPKTAAREELIQTIRAVHSGECAISPVIGARLAERMAHSELTARELDVLKLITRGRSNKEISGALGIAEVTVKLHVGHILAKLKVNDRPQAATTALQRGILHLE
jgi:two-component system, NarL family, response regulator